MVNYVTNQIKCKNRSISTKKTFIQAGIMQCSGSVELI